MENTDGEDLTSGWDESQVDNVRAAFSEAV